MKNVMGYAVRGIARGALLAIAGSIFLSGAAYSQNSGGSGGGTGECLVTKLRMRFATSDDDLRGGQDNLNVFIYFTTGGYQAALNVNHGQNWPNNSVNMVDIPLRTPVPPNEIRALRLVHIPDGSFRLNIPELATPAAPIAIAQAFQSPDNWNMADMEAAAIGNGVGARIAKHGFHRFTGSDVDLIIGTHIPPNICGSGRPAGNSGGGSGMLLAPRPPQGMLAPQPRSPGLLQENRVASGITAVPGAPNRKGAPGNSSGPSNTAGLAVNGTRAKFVLPPNLKIFKVGEARNPAVLTALRSGALLKESGGGSIGPEGTMSAPGNVPNGMATSMATSRPMLAGPAAMQPNSGGPSRQQSPGGARPSGNSRYSTIAPNTMNLCMGKTGISAVNGGKYTQFTPGTQYGITGCGFGSAPGKVYLTGPFPAHNGRIDLGPSWVYGTQRSWTGHWSDQRIDAQLDAGLSGELDQYNVSLVVETSTGQQIQMGNVSFQAQRAEFMLSSIPSSAFGFNPDPWGAADSPCTSSWVTSNCTVDVLRAIAVSGINPSPDTYTIKLKSGFVLSRVVLLIMSQTKVTQWTTPNINGNQIVVNWNWTYGPGSYKYSLYGLQIYVIGPLGVTDAWAGQ
jgi:hypothetical protein